MRKRLLIVAGVIALAGVLVWVLPRKPPPFSIQVLGQTNIWGRTHYVLLVSNCTDRGYYLELWSEYRVPGGDWRREFLEAQRTLLGPHSVLVVPTPMPARGKHRFTLIYVLRGPITLSSGSRSLYWEIRRFVGLNPRTANRLHVQVE
jgi:hypothetical protein